MNYFYYFKKNKNGTVIDDLIWQDLVVFLRILLKLDTCVISLYNNELDAFLAKLKNEPLKTYETRTYLIKGEKAACYDITLDIDTYLSYLDQFGDSFSWPQGFEDPKLFTGEQLIINAVSHENYIEFFINESEKNAIESKFNINLSQKS